MSHVTAHVLDASRGRPAAGITVSLSDHTGRPVAEAVTDDDGRVGSFGPDRLEAGAYTVRFDSGDYFAGQGVTCFHPYVVVVFSVEPGGEHYHIPLLLSPYSYTTYRGS